MKIINYESDFKIIEGFKDKSPITTAPFRFSYYTKMSKRTYVAEYDGLNYTNCKPTDDGRIVVAFDNHKLGMGVLNVKREFFLTDKDFADGICNLVSVETTGITLDSGATDEIDDIVIEVFPFYQQGETGKSAYQEWLDLGNEGTVVDFLASLKGDKGEDGKSFTYDDMTDAEKEDLAGHFNLEVVNNLEDGGKDKALSAEMGKRLNEMISEISLELSGKLNLTSIDEIKSAQRALSKTNEIAFYLVTDSTGKIPSAQSCYNIPSEAVRKLSLTSPDVTTNIVLDLLSVNMQPIGVNVGDFIALTRVKVKVSDLAASIGVSINLGGEIEIYQYKILSMNDAKPAGHSEANAGVMGLMSPWDKGQVNKISGIEVTANNALPKKDVLPSRWANNMNDALQTGVYPWCDLGRPSGSTGHYTCIVNRTSTDDGSFNTIEQTAYGREAELGQVYKRIIFQHKDGNEIQFGEWINITSSGKSGTDEITAHCIILSDTNKVSVEHDLSTMSTIGVSIIAKDANSDVGYYCPSLYYNGSFFVFAFDYTYIVVKGPEGNFLVVEKQPTYSERFATKDEVGYQPPVGGIPKKDLSQEVQASLGKADTALQEAFAENLLLNARFSNNAEKWDGRGYQVINDIHGRGVSGVKLDEGNVEQHVDVEEGYHTLSFWHTGLYGENYVYVAGDCVDFESNLGEVGGSGEYILPNHDSPKKYNIRFYAYKGTLAISFDAGGRMSISEVKLEKSKKASDFSLNTSDIADKYTVPTKDEVATAITNAITNTLNTEV